MALKKVAGTLVNVLDSPRIQTILDKTQPIQPIIDEMTAHWSYDLFTRSPGAAYTDDDVFVGTDLDLACFLFALAERGAVINIPKYTSRRPKQVTQGEVVVSADNRHGKILAVLANKENLSFSIRIMDANVMTTDSVGNFRNFMLVDVDGTWYDGWKSIEFVPNTKENDFLTNNSLWSGNSVVFKNFIHPNRWVSFYGQHYYATKVLIERLTDEAKHLKGVANNMRARGVKIGGFGGEKKEWPQKTVVGAQKSIKVQTIEAEVEFPEIQGTYKLDLPGWTYSNDSELLKGIEDRARQLTYSIIPKLRFATRATEFAFMKNSDNGLKMPAWIDGARWDRTFVQSGKKKVWSRMTFAKGVAVRYRLFDKSEIVADE